jgi:hypothetical protein
MRLVGKKESSARNNCSSESVPLNPTSTRIPIGFPESDKSRVQQCLLRAEKHRRQQPLEKHSRLLRKGFVEAARFLGGQPFASFATNLRLARTVD